ncbi:MAG: protein translocase subunit SecF [Acidiferrobacteraceae bacterium]|nr:protein translocase subunit SecF [Acidiferrobacteraceae bacterium]MCP4828005.1 protein translocase subunit SecF [Pseudomonadota bacterium]HJP06624.1 protein translocase subunit SecF [Arenicellales bacterium]|tara:strand:+ start:746 stop:1756 length:1011 start_codon:yes stop_codon:yes gene_type:complete
MRFFKKVTDFDFLGKRQAALFLSLALVVASAGSLGLRGLNFGIDFTGGTLVELAYLDSTDPVEVRAVLKEAGIADAIVQYFGTSRDILVRLPVVAGQASAEQSSAVVAALRAASGETLAESPEGGLQRCLSGDSAIAADCQVQMRRVEFVGPQVGGELTEKGGLAMLYALIGILVYVAIRFEWRFAVGAVIALVHDVMITLGLFSLLALEFSLPVLAAVLAVIGYSLNDTIVVFDRVRDNFRKMRKGSVTEIMNRSVNQTLPRTVLTSVTTLLVVLTLLLAGGEIIKGFAMALLIGVIIGTYSSIFVASPTVLMLGISREDMLPVPKEGAEGDSAP